MDTVIKVMILFFLSTMASCKRWDPNLKYAQERSKIEKHTLDQTQFSDYDPLIDLQLNQSLSEVTKLIGKDYRILASLKKNNTSWLKIEVVNERSDTPNGRTELLFKNNLLVKIYNN